MKIIYVYNKNKTRLEIVAYTETFPPLSLLKKRGCRLHKLLGRTLSHSPSLPQKKKKKKKKKEEEEKENMSTRITNVRVFCNEFWLTDAPEDLSRYSC